MLPKHRHAFLIMAHNNWYVLEKLISMLDADWIDIYIHIDKKVPSFDRTHFASYVKHSRIFNVKRHNVTWGNETQVKAEMELFKAAYRKGPYWYYHFISGSDLILKPLSQIYNFFENRQENFIQTLPAEGFMWRMQTYINVFRQSWLPTSISKKLNIWSEILQYKFHINRLNYLSKHYPLWAKGHNWCSLTHPAVSILIQESKHIKKITRFTHCSDELYKQIILLNHPEISKSISDVEIRKIDWVKGENHPKTYDKNNLKELLNSDCIFARKFEDAKSKECVDSLFNHITKCRETER